MAQNITFVSANRVQCAADLNCPLHESVHYGVFYFLKENDGSFLLNGNVEDIINNRLFLISPNVKFSIECEDVPIDCFYVSFDFEERPLCGSISTPYFIIVPQDIRVEFVRMNIQLAAACLVMNKEGAASKLAQILDMMEQMTLQCCIALATRNVGRMIRDIPRHFHYNEYQIDYFKSGSGTIFINDRWVNYSNDSLCFIPPKVPHEIVFPQSNEIDNYSIKFKIMDDSSTQIPNEPFVLTIAEEKRNILLTLIKKIVGEFVMDLPIPANRITNLISLLHEIKDDKALMDTKEKDLLNQVKQIVNSNYSKELSISMIAYSLGFSPEHLSRQFRKKTGQTLIAYITAQRLEASLTMLQKTTMPLKQIAYECGFNNVNYYTTIFKKHYSITPGDIRKQKTIPE